MLQRIIEHAINYDWWRELNEFDQLFHWLINQVTCNHTRKFVISFTFLDIVNDVNCILRVDLSLLNKIFDYLNTSEWCEWETFNSYWPKPSPTYSQMWKKTMCRVADNWRQIYDKSLLVRLKTIFDRPDKNKAMHRQALLLKKFVQNIHEMMVQSCRDLRYSKFKNFEDNVMKGYIQEMTQSKQKNMKDKTLALVYLCIDFENFKID